MYPRKIMQFWHGAPPAEIAALMATWREHNPSWTHVVFDAEGARAYLKRHGLLAALAAFDDAGLPAMASDIFRVAWCLHEGGVYVDAATRCLAPLDSWLPGDGLPVVVRKWHGGLWNGLFAVQAADPMLAAVMSGILTNVQARSSEDVWQVTGPGVLNAVLAEQAWPCHVFEQAAMRTRFSFVQDLPHKREGHWSVAQKSQSIYLSRRTAHLPAALPTNALEINLFGLQRSGNHAVIAWILQQFEQPQMFCNNVTHFTDPYLNSHYADLAHSIQANHLLKHKGVEAVNDLRRQPKALLLVSYENLSLARLHGEDAIADRAQTVGNSAALFRVLLLRDYFNWMSSRIKLFANRQQALSDPWEAVRSLSLSWLSYARAFQNERPSGFDPTVRISFNRWTQDAAYRLDVLDRLQIPCRNNDNTYVPNVGGGSSFDQTAFSGNASAMAIHARGALLSDEHRRHVDRVLEAFPEIATLNEAIFGLSRPW